MKSNEKIRAALVEHFGEHGAIPKSDQAAVESVAAECCKAVAQLRRQRILAAFARLPADRFIEEIESARDALSTALQKYHDVETELAELRRKETALLESSTDLADITKLRSEIMARENLVRHAVALKQAREGLGQVVARAGEAISRLARLQDQRETVMGGLGSWHRFGGFAPFSIANSTEVEKAEALLGVTRDALAEIRDLQEGKLPSVLFLRRRREHFVTFAFAIEPDEP